jgi:hypothetical protein
MAILCGAAKNSLRGTVGLLRSREGLTYHLMFWSRSQGGPNILCSEAGRRESLTYTVSHLMYWSRSARE